MNYRISYYAADGLGPDHLCEEIEDRTYTTLEEARAAIHKAVGNHGSWTDDGGHECWHESELEGCGGFEIYPA